MKEEEARNKVCKRVMLIGNSGYPEEQWIYCCASNCMKWRYNNPEYIKGDEDDKKLNGYCGLGGKP